MGKRGKKEIWIRQHPELDPVSPDLDPATSGYGSGFAGSRSGEIRIWIRFRRIQLRQYPDLDPFWPDLDPGSGSKDMVMDPFRLYKSPSKALMRWCMSWYCTMWPGGLAHRHAAAPGGAGGPARCRAPGGGGAVHLHLHRSPPPPQYSIL